MILPGQELDRGYRVALATHQLHVFGDDCAHRCKDILGRVGEFAFDTLKLLCAARGVDPDIHSAF